MQEAKMTGEIEKGQRQHQAEASQKRPMPPLFIGTS